MIAHLTCSFRTGFFFGILSLLIFLPRPSFGVEVYLGTERTGSGAVTLAIPPFQVITLGAEDKETGTLFAEVLRYDLEFSNYFAIVQNQQFVEEVDQLDREKGTTQFGEWKTLRADALIKGTILFRPDETVSVECRMFDVAREKELRGFRLTSHKENVRKIAHRTSNRIIEQLTGRRGVALTKIVFISRFGTNKEIYTMDYDGKNVNRVTYENSIALFPKWSPDLTQILFTTYKFRNPDVYLVSADGKDRRPLSTKLGLNSSGAWSPDGESVAFSLSMGGNMEIVVTDKFGNNMKRLTDHRAIDTTPTWSPDGKRIAFTSGRSGTPQIYVMNREGGDLTRLTFTGTYNDLADWSPTEDVIAFSSMRDGRFDIVTLDLARREEIQLTSRSGNNENPSWSPDGRHLAFSSSRGGGTQIYTMNRDGSNQRRITNLGGMAFSPDWSPRFE